MDNKYKERTEKVRETRKLKSQYSDEEWSDKYRFQKKYDKENGLIVKSYKLEKTITEKFKQTCMEKGLTQSSVLSKIMLEFIEENETNEKEN